MARQPEGSTSGVAGPHTSLHGIAQRPVDGPAFAHFFVERAVRLDRLDVRPGGPAHDLERPELVAERRLQLATVDVHRLAAEARPVRVGRVGADPHGVSQRGGDGGGHGGFVTGVAAAGHVGRGHEGEHGALTLDALGVARLADVGVQVDVAFGHALILLRAARPRRRRGRPPAGGGASARGYRRRWCRSC